MIFFETKFCQYEYYQIPDKSNQSWMYQILTLYLFMPFGEFKNHKANILRLLDSEVQRTRV